MTDIFFSVLTASRPLFTCAVRFHGIARHTQDPRACLEGGKGLYKSCFGDQVDPTSFPVVYSHLTSAHLVRKTSADSISINATLSEIPLNAATSTQPKTNHRYCGWFATTSSVCC